MLLCLITPTPSHFHLLTPDQAGTVLGDCWKPSWSVTTETLDQLRRLLVTAELFEVTTLKATFSPGF